MNTAGIVMRLAWRNLWRNYRRTIIMLMAISIGTWAMIFLIAMSRGMVGDMIRDGINALPGYVQVHHPDYRDDPSVENLITMSSGEIEYAFEKAGIQRFSARVRVPAMVSSERVSRGVTLVGIDPVKESLINAVGSNIAEGRNLESVDDAGVVIGHSLADKLETAVGKRIVLMSQGPDNEVVDRGFRVIGLFDANFPAQEERFVFVGRAVVQTMLGIGDAVSEVAVSGHDYRDVEPLLQQVRQVIKEKEEVLSWEELDKYLSTMMGVMDGFVFVLIIVIFLALSFGLVNTLVMAVFERVREIGLMLALGMRPSSILGQIIVESVLLLLIGLAIGTALAYTTVLSLPEGIEFSGVADGMELFGAPSVLHPTIHTKDIVMVNILVLVLGFLASLSPAWRASRYEPVEAITKV